MRGTDLAPACTNFVLIFCSYSHKRYYVSAKTCPNNKPGSSCTSDRDCGLPCLSSGRNFIIHMHASIFVYGLGFWAMWAGKELQKDSLGLPREGYDANIDRDQPSVHTAFPLGLPGPQGGP
ncbi:hypothetical protein BaRGS_00026698 [Batillaria attramentaria]|uniref:Uncharacterized protein n=1 Tax=Batillaria attramentaria TaxID=370345 RepID=A0ABD0K501_9CAEN